MSDACSDAVPTRVVRAPGLQVAIERLELAEHASHPHDGVAAVARPAAVRGASFGLNLDPLESLVRDGDMQVRRLGHDAGVGAPLGHERFGADAGVLLVDDAGDDETAGVEAAGLGDDAGGANHRRDAALHVLRPAAVDAAVALGRIERTGHAGDADRVDVSAEHQRSSRRPALEHPDDVRTVRGGFLHVGLEADGAQFLDERARNRRLAGGARDERRVDGIDGNQLFAAGGLSGSSSQSALGRRPPGQVVDRCRRCEIIVADRSAAQHLRREPGIVTRSDDPSAR